MALVWSKKYSIGFPEIDEQHKELIRLINALEDISINHAMYKNLRQPIEKVVGELKNYTVLHFATEEVLFRMFDYQNTDEHKETHDGFVKLVLAQQKNIGDLLNRIESEKNEERLKEITEELVALINKLTEFLQKWIVHHIMKSDFEYADFFNNIKKKAASSGWFSFLKG